VKTTETSAGQAIGARVFDRVLVGVDGSEAGREAAVQAARLVAPAGTLELVTAVYLIEASLQRWSEEDIEAVLELEGRPVIDAAAVLAGPRAGTRLLNGPPLQALLDEAKSYHATLIVVGSHGQSRLSELLIGGVSGPLLHTRPPGQS
jgi:nucleotide-binding universal stress UspA family protein